MLAIVSVADYDHQTQPKDVEQLREGTKSSLISYIINCVASGTIDTTAMVKNVSEAIALQFKLMEQNEKFREESAQCINSSPDNYSTILKLILLICVNFFKGMYVARYSL